MNTDLRAIGAELRRRLKPVLALPLSWPLIDRLVALEERDAQRGGDGKPPPDTSAPSKPER